MAAYLVRRLAYGAVTVLGVLLLLFILFFTVTDPDDIARKAVGERARPDVYVQWKKNHGYDKPLLINSTHQASDSRRYTDTLLFEHYRRMLTFDFGRSDADDTPITKRLRDGAGPSLSLTVPLFVLGLMVGVAAALFVAFFRETYIDRAVLVLCMLTMSVASLLFIIGGQYLDRHAAQVVSHLRVRPERRGGGPLPGAAGAGGRGHRASAPTCGSTGPSSSRR